jgi:hypothetical protein
MKFIKTIIQVGLLGTALYFSIASSGEEIWRYSNGLWVVENLFEGETSVEPYRAIRLTIGNRDFVKDGELGVTDTATKRAKKAFKKVSLYRADTLSPVGLDIEIGDRTTVINHDLLDENADYVLDLDRLQYSLRSSRLYVDPIGFSTAKTPQVLGLWKNEDTLIVVFSQTMDAETLTIGHNSVDYFWEEDDELHSICSDLNLADFVWAAGGHIFMVASVDILVSPGWLRISGDARSTDGEFLDGNGNGIPGEPDDDYLVELKVSDLETCYSRDDIPAPCVSENDVPVNVNWNGTDQDDDW